MIRPPPRSPLFPSPPLSRSDQPVRQRTGAGFAAGTGTFRGAMDEPVAGTEKDQRRREEVGLVRDRKSTRLNSSHLVISYAVFCLKKKKKREYCSEWEYDKIR